MDRFLEKVEGNKTISIDSKSLLSQGIQENKGLEVKKQTISEPLSLYSFDKLIEKSLKYYIQDFNEQMFKRIINGYLYFITYIPEILIEIDEFRNGLDSVIEKAEWNIEYEDKINRDIGKGINQNLIKMKISCIPIEVEEDREEIVNDIGSNIHENENSNGYNNWNLCKRVTQEGYKSLNMMDPQEIEKRMQEIERKSRKGKV